MINILLSGACGRMGKAVAEACAASGNLRVVAGIDISALSCAAASAFPLFEKPSDFTGSADVIIDFSHHTALPALLDYAVKNKIPVIAATTGHDADELNKMNEASKIIPIFYSRNMSLGINLLIELTKKAAAVLGKKYDIEIIERHHNKKLDAPSGTALMIADAASEVLGTDPEYVYDRHSERRARSDNEIGIHSVRGGTIVGDHEVAFCGQDEVISLSHSAYSRSVFADGAVAAAQYIIGKPAGIYNMSDLISETVEA